MDVVVPTIGSHLWKLSFTQLITSFAFYLMIVVCVAQTFYPLFMIANMWIRRANIFYHYFHKVDENSIRHGGELVAAVLKGHGVEHFFTLSGGHISPVLTAAEKLGIRIVDTRHEVNAVFAADATARLSGVPGVAVVTAGPGVTNTITALKNAQLAESPVILLGGCSATLLKGRGALQDIDQLSVLKSITKKTFTIMRLRDIVPKMREAFKVAQSGTPGPVFVELPIDILYPYQIVKKEFIAGGNAKGIVGRIINWYLTNYLKNLFAGAFDQEWPTHPLPIDIPFPKSKQVTKAAELVSKAKKPLIILGSQSILPPVGAEKLRAAIEALGIPVYLGGMSRGLLGASSTINMKQSRREALRDADVVILGGSVADFRLSYGKVFSKKSKIIAVNRSKEQLYKNSRVFWNPELAIQADSAQFFVQLAQSLQGYKVDPDWMKLLRDREVVKEQNARKMADNIPDEHLNPIKVLHDLEDCLDDKTILVADGGDFVGSAAYILRPRGPLRWLDPGAYGTLGVGGGFALGAKLCRPDYDVVIIYGDGSLGYSLMEFDTFVRHKLPVLALVGNDACWTQIAREQKPMLGSDVGCMLAYNDYHKAVEGLGAKGILLDAPDRDKIKDIIQEAKKTVRSGQPVLINALIGKTKFREGSISV